MSKPPIAPTHEYQTTDGRSDSYFWLKDKDNPAVLDYLKAENAYCKTMLESTDALQEQLFQEMLSRIQETDSSAPWRMGDFDYYFRTVKDGQYRIFCRKPHDQADAPETILLDENALAAQQSYFNIGTYALSPDQNRLAYTVDTVGDEYYTLVIKDLRNNSTLSDNIQGIGADLVFSADNQHIWYVRLDKAHRPHQIWQHQLGQDSGADQLVIHEKDERYFLSPMRSKDDQMLFVHCESKLTTEVHYTNAHAPELPLQCLYPRETGIEYYVDHHDGHFIIQTNEQAANFQLVQVPVDATDKKNWQTLLAHHDNIAIEDIEIFSDYFVVLERCEGLPQLHVLGINNAANYRIDFPEPSYSVSFGQNWHFPSNTLRFVYESLKSPSSFVDFDLTNKHRTLIKQTPVLGDFAPEDYVSERIFAKAPDGVLIPISLVYKKGLDKPAPLYLNGYGAYRIDSDPWFSSLRLSLLNRGFIFAIAHIRGGGEYGKAWHDAGKLFNKQNSFDDFIACADHLVQENYTTPAQQVIMGGSAGGLLMGAAINKRPDLFAACIAHVPFVDVLSTMLDDTLPLTITEYEEWGDPNQKEPYAYIKAYSPYDNIKPQKYPAILATAGLNDSRVPYWEAAKWVAKIRQNNHNDQLVLLKTELESGHGGVSGRYNALREVALEYAFVLRVLSQ